LYGLKDNEAGSSNMSLTWPEKLLEIFLDGIGDLFTDEGGLVVLAVLVAIVILAVVLRVAWESWRGSPPNPLG
jgi:hypothetical protein